MIGRRIAVMLIIKNDREAYCCCAYCNIASITIMVIVVTFPFMFPPGRVYSSSSQYFATL